MKAESHFLVRRYATRLRLYPTASRASFGEEIHQVLTQVVEDAAAESRSALAMVVLQEIRDLPGAALTAHWRAKAHDGDRRGSKRGKETSHLKPHQHSLNKGLS